MALEGIDPMIHELPGHVSIMIPNLQQGEGPQPRASRLAWCVGDRVQRDSSESAPHIERSFLGVHRQHLDGDLEGSEAQGDEVDYEDPFGVKKEVERKMFQIASEKEEQERLERALLERPWLSKVVQACKPTCSACSASTWRYRRLKWAATNLIN